MTNSDLLIKSDSSPEIRLLAAVVGLAIKDASLPPFVEGPRKRGRLASDTMTAMDFLFTKTSDGYLDWLDIDSKSFRNKLFKLMHDQSKRNLPITDMQRRYLRQNYQIWKEMFDLVGGPVADDAAYDEPHKHLE